MEVDGSDDFPFQVIFRFNMFFQGVPCMEFAPTPGESSRKNVKHDILVMFFFWGGGRYCVFEDCNANRTVTPPKFNILIHP